MDEVLAGDFYHEQTESVPEQTWSSASFFHAAVSGLLGLQVDGVTRQVVFTPHIPADWKSAAVRNIELPAAKIALIWTRTSGGSALEAINRGDTIHLTYSPEIPLGSALKGARWNGKPIHARVEDYEEDEHATVDVRNCRMGLRTSRWEYSGGDSLVATTDSYRDWRFQTHADEVD